MYRYTKYVQFDFVLNFTDNIKNKYIKTIPFQKDTEMTGKRKKKKMICLCYH